MQYWCYTWQQRKLFTILLFVRGPSAALLSSVTHFVHVNLELRSMVRESVPQTNYTELRSLTLWTCTPSAHPKTVFQLRSSLGLQVHLELTIFFCWVDKMSHVTRGFVLQSDLYHQSRAPKVDNFPVDVSRPSPPPVFWGESLGLRLTVEYPHLPSYPDHFER